MLITITLTLLVFAAAVLVAYFGLIVLAQAKVFVTSVPEGHCELVVQGNTLVPGGVLLRMKGYKVVDDKIVVGDDNKTGLLRSYGIWFYGLTWPWKRIHWFHIDAGRIKKDEEGRELPIPSLIEHELKFVNSLRVKFPRPVLIREVELPGDQTRVDAIVQTIWRVVNPRIPVFVYEGKYGTLLDRAVKGAVTNAIGRSFGQTEVLTFVNFVKLDKMTVTKELLRLNDPGEDTIVKSTEETFGMVLEEAWIVEYDLAEEDKKVQQAQQAENIAKLNAKAKIAEAAGEAEAMKMMAEAQGKQIWDMIKSQIDQGVSPDVAATSVNNILSALAHSRDTSKITFLGGASPLVSVPTSAPQAKPASDGEEKPNEAGDDKKDV